MKFWFVPILLGVAIFRLIGADLQIAVLSDLHVTPGNPNETTLAEVVDEINASEYDLVIVDGDLTNYGKIAELSCVKKLLSKINKPIHVLPGNHETTWSDNGITAFSKLFGAEHFVLDKNGFLMIGLSCGPYMKMGDAYVRPEEVTFLKNALKEYAKKGTPVIVFIHYPLAQELSNGSEIADILSQYNTLALVCGHTHSKCRRNIYGIEHIVCRPLLENRVEE